MDTIIKVFSLFPTELALPKLKKNFIFNQISFCQLSA